MFKGQAASDRAKAGLRGSVKRCESEWTSSNASCSGDQCRAEPETRRLSTKVYDLQGRLLQELSYHADGSESNTVYTYDSDGRLREVDYVSPGHGEAKRISHYRDGRLVRVTTRTDGLEERIEEEYHYKPDGRKIKTHYVAAEALPEGAMFFYAVEGVHGNYSAERPVKITTEYDEKGKGVELCFYDLQGSALSTVVFRYDEEGRLVEESQSTEALPAGLVKMLSRAQLETMQSTIRPNQTRTLHRYDEHGRRVETRSEIGTLSVEIARTSYNDYGDPATENREHKSKELGFNWRGGIGRASEKSVESVTHFEYDYDEHGNWIRKTLSGRGEDGEVRTYAVERRKISYHTTPRD